MSSARDIHPDEVADILEFWLGEVGPARWYVEDDALDAQIRDRFGPLWECAAKGGLRPGSGPRPALAILILLDQFPRNMFRGTGRAFATDRLACPAAKRAIRTSLDLQIPEPERQFFYLPLMHSECLADQERCLRMLMLRMPEHGAQNLGYGIGHRAVIRRFGRFPSRNAALGRRDTAAERAYRAEGGYMSGAATEQKPA